jgi:transposase
VIQIAPQMRILVAVAPVDFRKGIDGLVRVCKEALEADAFSGYLFVFRNRRRTAIKILTYDSRGFWLCQKRLSAGRFRFWPESASEAAKALEAHELQVLPGRRRPAIGPGSAGLAKHRLKKNKAVQKSKKKIAALAFHSETC